MAGCVFKGSSAGSQKGALCFCLCTSLCMLTGSAALCRVESFFGDVTALQLYDKK